MGEIKTDNYPNNVARVIHLKPGDCFWICNTGEALKVGEKYKNYPAFVKDITYVPRPWWMFWKKKQVYGYYIQWLGE